MPVLSVESEGIVYCLPPSDAAIPRQTFIYGNYEIDKLAASLDLIQTRTNRSLAGTDFLDIGANIGTTTIPAVKQHGFRHAYAFEPAPSNLRFLRSNLAINDLCERVTVFPVALSDRSGVLSMQLSLNCGDHRLVASDDDGFFHERSWPRIDVRVTTLDDVIAQSALDLSAVGVAWIDVQGHEARLLAGGVRLIDSEVPVLIEYWPYGLNRYGDLEQLHDLIARHYAVAIDLSTRQEYRGVEISSLAEQYAQPSEYTDLLLLKA